jgi:hypothetical protein
MVERTSWLSIYIYIKLDMRSIAGKLTSKAAISIPERTQGNERSPGRYRDPADLQAI